MLSRGPFLCPTQTRLPPAGEPRLAAAAPGGGAAAPGARLAHRPSGRLRGEPAEHLPAELPGPGGTPTAHHVVTGAPLPQRGEAPPTGRRRSRHASLTAVVLRQRC